MENRLLDDQLDHPALRLIAARPDIFARQGHIAASYRRRNSKTFGPYYRLSYRENGRQRSVYLGVAGTLVDHVRRQLSILQTPLVQRRSLQRLQRSIRASLRTEKLHLATLLRPFGLRLKGFEVRGWRFSPLRNLFPRRRFFAPRLFISKSGSVYRQTEDPASKLRRFLTIRDGNCAP